MNSRWNNVAVVTATAVLALLAVPPVVVADDAGPQATTAIASPEAWSPVRVFVGSWSGSRSGPKGQEKVTRDYESLPIDQHLRIGERAHGQSETWGVIRFDAERHELVLERYAADGHGTVLALDPAAASDTRLVFTGSGGDPGRTRISYQRVTWNEFVERIEYAPEGQDFGLVSETRFKRKG